MSDDLDPLAPGGPTTIDLPVPDRALVIVAHPDDAEFQAGATLAKWARAGCEVHHLVLTDGSKGTWDPTVDPAELVAERHREQHAAAHALTGSADAGRVHFLDLIDGELVCDVTNRGLVARVIRQVRPTVVIGHDPWKRYRLHPDHRAAGKLCVDGIVAARDPGFHPELLRDGLDPHRPEVLLLFEPDVANHAELATDADHVTRLTALEAFASQIATTHLYKVDSIVRADGKVPADGDGDTGTGTGEIDPMAAWRNRERARLAGPGAWAGATLAEPFRLIVDQL
ncbi:MAG TPA: PIG-L family deacetylase [Microthrixaceae bacterium]|nr:PIG-L family deacetylase [Microthrixaceae bacterium]